MPIDKTEFLDHGGARIGFRRSRGKAGRAGLVWLGGFHSDMAGEKAGSLHAAAEAAGRSFVRFDYFGHGESGGAFADGTVGRWRGDALAVVDELTDGPLVLAGSSMGGWMALLAALARPERVTGLVLLAPAADFTERLMWAGFDEPIREQIMETGAWTRPSPYDPAGYPITRRLIEEGRDWLIMDRPIGLQIPVAILQGQRDEDVPWTYAQQLVERIAGDAVTFTLVKDGDHRLSRPQDISLMIRTALAMADQVDAPSA